jgi:hypothetical protein
MGGLLTISYNSWAFLHDYPTKTLNPNVVPLSTKMSVTKKLPLLKDSLGV